MTLARVAVLVVILANCGPGPGTADAGANTPADGGTDGGPSAVDAGHDAGSTRPMALSVRTLVTLGSSSTAGAGASSEATRYVNLLASWLGAGLVNLGTSGQTVGQVASTYLPQAFAALDAGSPPSGQVDLVTFLPFTDFASLSAQAIADGYDPILSQLDGTGAYVVFGVPSVDERYACGTRGDLRGPDGECYDAALVDDYAAKGAAVRLMLSGHPLASPADVPQQQAEHPDWQALDGHPNDLGHADIARAMSVEIARRLGLDGGM